jgi:hypothetical protein
MPITRPLQSTIEMLHIELDIHLEIKIGFAKKTTEMFYRFVQLI